MRRKIALKKRLYQSEDKGRDLNIDAAREVYDAVELTSLERLKLDLFSAAARYARIRADWHLASLGQKKELDRTRRLAHNALIDACNVLSRNMLKAGENNDWRAVLGDRRKEIGDFACYLHAIFGILAR